MFKYALLVGVSEYDHKDIDNLPKSIHDVDAIAEVLQAKELGGFHNIQILKNPTRDNFARSVNELFANRQADDLVVFYFSGHGMRDRSFDLHFALPKTELDAKKVVKSYSAYRTSEIHREMNASKSERQVVILDCCFSGSFAKDLKVKGIGKLGIQADELGGKGRAILTSSAATKYSFTNGNSDLSIYTHYLVEGIRSGAADRNNDGFISVEELSEYTTEKVTQESSAMSPQFYPVLGGYTINLAKSPQDTSTLKYREKVIEIIQTEHNAIDFIVGKFDPIDRDTLNLLREELKLDVTVAAEIEKKEIQPYRLKQERINRFQSAYKKSLITNKNSLDRDQIRRLRRFQAILGLKDEDISQWLQPRDRGNLVKESKQQSSKHYNALPQEPIKKQYLLNKPVLEISNEQQDYLDFKTRDMDDVTCPKIQNLESSSQAKKVREKTTSANNKKNIKNDKKQQYIPNFYKKIIEFVSYLSVGAVTVTMVIYLSQRNNIQIENRETQSLTIKGKAEVTGLEDNEIGLLTTGAELSRDAIFSRFPKIEDSLSLAMIQTYLYRTLNDAWQNRLGDKTLSFEVFAISDGSILAAFPVDGTTDEDIELTPFKDLVLHPDLSSGEKLSKNKYVAQFKVIFNGQVLEVSPWSSSIGEIDFDSSEIRGDALRELIVEIRRDIVKALDSRSVDTDETLYYNIGVTDDKEIAFYISENAAAEAGADKTPLPYLINPGAAGIIPGESVIPQEPLTQVIVRFRPNGVVEVSPWAGYR